MLVPTLMKFHLLPLRKPYYVAIGEAQFYQAVEALNLFCRWLSIPTLREIILNPPNLQQPDALPSLKKNNSELLTQLKLFEALGRWCFFGSKKREPTCVEYMLPLKVLMFIPDTPANTNVRIVVQTQSIDIYIYNIYISYIFYILEFMYLLTSADTQQSRQDEVVKIDKQQTWILGPGIWRRHPTTLQSQSHGGVQPNTTIFYLRQYTRPGLG